MGPQPHEARPVEFRRWLLLAVAAVLCAVLGADWARVPTEPIRAGEVAAHTVKAPFTFTYQDLGAYAAARASAAEQAPLVFVWDDTLVPSLADRLSDAFRRGREALAEPGRGRFQAASDAFRSVLPEATEPTAAGLAAAGFPLEAEVALSEWLARAYEGSLVVADRSELPTDGRPLRLVSRKRGEAVEMRADDRLIDLDAVKRAGTLAALRARVDAPWYGPAQTLLGEIVRPTLVLDVDRTEQARLSAESAVEPEPLVIQRGETLFREGDRITQAHVVMYEALQRSRAEHPVYVEVAAIAGFLFLVFASLYAAGRRFFDHDQGDRELLGLGGTLCVTALLARIVVSSAPGMVELLGNDARPESVWYLVPVAGGTMLIRVLMGLDRAAMYVLAASAICAVLMRFDALAVIYFVLTSLVAAVTVEHVRERISVLRAGLATGAFGAVVVLLLHFVDLYAGTGEVSLAVTVRPLWSMAFALLGGLLSGFFVVAVMPVFENLGFVTDHRMLELASLNHPLLRQLMLRAPGTYHHSVIVGTLAEAACEAIGANSLQAKISAYFHDIGKALQPRYFVENQRGGPNPHAELGDPVESARVIIRHVTEGARMAREHRLPKPIYDNILMHHGTGLLQYFYAQAQAQAGPGGVVDEAAFRYPGPKPNTREAGVVMLADKVEAATRTIKQPTEENIRAMITRIINSVLSDNQFTECPLTFQEIHTIADTFVTVLLAIHHQRIEYPQTSAISRGEGARAAAAAPVGASITLEFETRALSAADEPVWRPDGDDAEHDAETDYESVRNLPHGDL